MPLSTQDALIHLMVIAASSDAQVSDRELEVIGSLVDRAAGVRRLRPRRAGRGRGARRST